LTHFWHNKKNFATSVGPPNPTRYATAYKYKHNYIVLSLQENNAFYISVGLCLWSFFYWNWA